MSFDGRSTGGGGGRGGHHVTFKSLVLSIVGLAIALPIIHSMIPKPYTVAPVTAFMVLALALILDWYGEGDPWTDRVAWAGYAAGGASLATGTGYVSWATVHYLGMFQSAAGATSGNLSTGIRDGGPALGIGIFVIWTFFVLWPEEWVPSYGITALSLFQKLFRLKHKVAAHKKLNTTLILTAIGWIACAPLVPPGTITADVYDFVSWLAQLILQGLAILLNKWLGVNI